MKTSLLRDQVGCVDTRLPRSTTTAACFVLALVLLLALQQGAVTAQPRWEEEHCGFSTPDLLHMPDVVDGNVVWVLSSPLDGPSLEFSRTTDGGATWIPGTVTGASGTPTAIEGLDALTAWVGYKTTVFDRARIYKTTNGGTTWVLQSTAFNQGGYINDIHFFDADNGVAMGDPNGGYFEIFTTTNGGTNWTRVPSANIPPPMGDAGYPTSSGAYGDNIWFGTIAGPEARVFRSTDRGIHWTAAIVDFGFPVGARCATGLAFSDATHGLVVGHEHTGNTGKAARTTDGGVTWTALDSPPVCPFFLAWLPGTTTFVTTNTYGAFVGGVGSAYSTDYGAHWTLINQEFLGPVEFASPTAGWCGGFTYLLGARPLPALELARPASCRSPLVAEHFPSTGTTPVDPRSRLLVLGGAWKWVESTVAVNEAGTALPERLAHRSYPNPFNPAATIEFTLPTASHTRLRVYSSAGQEVATLVYGSLAAGRHAAHWDAADRASGVYFYRLEAGGKVTSGRLVLAK